MSFERESAFLGFRMAAKSKNATFPLRVIFSSVFIAAICMKGRPMNERCLDEYDWERKCDYGKNGNGMEGGMECECECEL